MQLSCVERNLFEYEIRIDFWDQLLTHDNL